MTCYEIGQKCADFRRNTLKCTQVDVANSIGVSFNAVSAFETGRSKSGKILMWYLEKGVSLYGDSEEEIR